MKIKIMFIFDRQHYTGDEMYVRIIQIDSHCDFKQSPIVVSDNI